MSTPANTFCRASPSVASAVAQRRPMASLGGRRDRANTSWCCASKGVRALPTVPVAPSTAIFIEVLLARDARSTAGPAQRAAVPEPADRADRASEAPDVAPQD